MDRNRIHNILIDIQKVLYQIYYNYKNRLTFFQYYDGSLLLMVDCKIKTYIDGNEIDKFAYSNCYLLLDKEVYNMYDLDEINQCFSEILDVGKYGDGIDVSKCSHRIARLTDMDIILKGVKTVFNLAIESNDFTESCINENFIDFYQRLIEDFHLN